MPSDEKGNQSVGSCIVRRSPSAPPPLPHAAPPFNPQYRRVVSAGDVGHQSARFVSRQEREWRSESHGALWIHSPLLVLLVRIRAVQGVKAVGRMACFYSAGRRHGARRARPRRSGTLSKAMVLVLVLALAGAPAADAQVAQHTETAASACADFAGGESFSGWNLEVCMDVWDEWIRSIQSPLREQYMDRQMVVETGERLRAQGSQCYAESPPVDDGIGSSAVRTIATWVFAEEMGCAWVRPHWGKGQIDSSGMTRYCHSSVSKDALALMTYDEKRAMFAETCVMVNWRQYFGFDKYSVESPEGDDVKSLSVRHGRETRVASSLLSVGGLVHSVTPRSVAVVQVVPTARGYCDKTRTVQDMEGVPVPPSSHPHSFLHRRTVWWGGDEPRTPPSFADSFVLYLGCRRTCPRRARYAGTRTSALRDPLIAPWLLVCLRRLLVFKITVGTRVTQSVPLSAKRLHPDPWRALSLPKSPSG